MSNTLQLWGPRAQCPRGRRSHCLLLRNGHHRRRGRSLSLPGTPTATSASALPLATRALTSSFSSSTSVSTGAPTVAPSLTTTAQPVAASTLTAASLALTTPALIALAFA